ncbi:MAG: helix-hairpin-helix domain-containing protein [Nanoarchaeota archaeon]|nr:helix-hairpin-helix domain-containing protein [Nanoarchaeota archaeon]
MKFSIILLFILLISFISASCSDSQIDINSASAERLDELYGIGPVKAEAIINSRPFESIDDLIKVSGIGETTLQKIKEQELACVEDEISPEETKITEEKIPVEYEKNDYIVYEKTNLEPEIDYTIPKESPVIKLNAQTIKSGEDTKKLDKSKYAVYGFVAFCVLLAVLFVLKLKKDKNEFEE